MHGEAGAWCCNGALLGNRVVNNQQVPPLTDWWQSSCFLCLFCYCFCNCDFYMLLLLFVIGSPTVWWTTNKSPPWPTSGSHKKTDSLKILIAIKKWWPSKRVLVTSLLWKIYFIFIIMFLPKANVMRAQGSKFPTHVSNWIAISQAWIDAHKFIYFMWIESRQSRTLGYSLTSKF